MTLAIFDLDNTLIGGDSDHLWGCFLCERGLVDSDEFGRQNEQFYLDYQRGQLDIEAYLRFALAPLANQPPERLAQWHRDFMAEVIEPIFLPAAEALIRHHREQGHRLLIITATNEFITRPIAKALGIDELLACEAEQVDGYYTGEPAGIPSFGEGKVTRLQAWLEQENESLTDSWFYSDSHNDLPLLEQVDNPVAVDPDDTLRAHAEAAGWPVISLR
ncbi:HAD family hydrolase [Parahaliea sp. F7430]|uniref:Histidinol-phosphatase n=1 Tax=Sediminihaliea albiluteola TaxID=2758564 RepID=A0A7W2YKB5_9GAMM|nr:HAD family hydrolase [Sediminihaliea albiluteola]MBA6413524.1 HAD family hydrolase [Sediminihaliea albiluteola]